MADGNQSHRRGRVVPSPPRHQPKPADPATLPIFGASGDPTRRLVLPAL